MLPIISGMFLYWLAYIAIKWVFDKYLPTVNAGVPFMALWALITSFVVIACTIPFIS